ncbi:DUF3810 domain-containing protein [Salinimicrobium flavum]|uniref:DUF3810 domain-containing protein n=1 Tax=Salinimicrobium flavum TaxID=1737065 RepID=A0ABW5ITW3_9FLAO
MKKRTALILALLLPVQIALVKIVAMFPQYVEDWYSTGIYPVTSSLQRMGLGFLPFSVGDLLYGVFIILLIRWLFLRFRQRFRNPRRWGLEALASLSIIYACFNIFWGFNYYRIPLHQTLEIDNDYTTEELETLTRHLINRSNEIHFAITGDDSLKVEMPYTKGELLKMTRDGYENIDDTFPELEYDRVSLKRSLYSLPLTYMGFNGYLNPITQEGQVNTVILPYKIPTTASHEIGHQLGFAKENEANFLACLTTMNHPDEYFRYSGYTFALSYCLSELYVRNPELTDVLLGEVNHGIRLNYLEVREFWARHANPFEPFFMYTYNSFLRANNQPEGMKSYSYVVALLVNYFKDRDHLL